MKTKLVKKNVFLLGAFIFLSSVSIAQNEWNSTNNSTAPMYRNGFVGIGTSAVPTLPFVVMDPTIGNGTKIALGNTAIQGSYGTADAILQLSSPNTSSGSFLSIASGIGTGRSELILSNSPFGAGLYSNKGTTGVTQPIIFATYGASGMTEKMRIQVNGKVGIGAPASYPGTYNLYVTGGILTEKVKVAISTTANWSDYVFDKNYKLKPLEEVDAFVKQNKHLPGVPSADEVVKEGIDMASMDAKLLEKIEELTLYVIDLKKELEKFKNENNSEKTSR